MTQQGRTIEQLFPRLAPPAPKSTLPLVTSTGKLRKPNRKKARRKTWWIDYVRRWGCVPAPENAAGQGRFMCWVDPAEWPNPKVTWRHAKIPYRKLRALANFDVDGPVHRFHVQIPNGGEGVRSYTGMTLLVDATRGQNASRADRDRARDYLHRYIIKPRLGGRILD